MNRTFDWDSEKNELLVRARGISFEAVVAAIEAGNLLAVVTGKGRLSHQKQFVVSMDQYVYVVPFVEDGTKVFLKTIISSREMTRLYLFGGPSYED